MKTLVLRTVARWASGAARGCRRAWRESAAAQEALVTINTPWRQDGELRWCRGSGGWELHGSHLPGAPVEPDAR